MTDEPILPEAKLSEARPAPEGWVLQSHPQTFSGHAGPFYFREEGGPPGVGFFSEQHHANLARIVHGGALMTLADMALFDIFFRANGRVPALTMTMNAEFLSPAPLGEFITATGEVMKAGRTTAFVRGVVSAKEKPVLSFSGVLKRLS
ncbi:MAG: PaaI family thioesterase [Alphaproteobacteria bacterium]|nr:PaaI family thioesterase [Alphaproteobacteria bacterium]